MSDREVRPLSEDLIGLGFSERTPGGVEAFHGMMGLMDVEFTPTTDGAAPAAEGALTEDRQPGAAAEADPIDGPVVTEETLECVGAILAHDLAESCDADVDIEAMDEAQVAQLAAVVEQRLADLQQVVDEMADKQVPDALVERTQEIMGRVLDEMKKVRILGGKVKAGDVLVDLAKHEVTVKGKQVELTATEFKLLHFLTQRPGWVFTRQQILDGVHGDNYAITDRAVDVQIVGLRRKLGSVGRYIETVRGVGYRFKE